MAFVEKHLDDPHYQEGVTSVSLRSVIFRELVANIIAHREYTSAAPATMAIHADRVEFTNPNNPRYHGRIDPQRFTPYPKNPTPCRFMIQLGRYEELGSGVRRVHRYLPHYAPGAGQPVFEDSDMFTVRLPLAAAPARGIGAPEVTPEVAPEVTPEVLRMLAVMHGEMGRREIQALLGLRDEKHFREAYQQVAVSQGLIEMTLPDKPRSRLQKYRLTERGRRLLGQSGVRSK